MTLPEIKDWHVETLRLTLFSSEPVQAAGGNWWSTVTGSQPDATLNRANTGEYSESGEFLGGQLELRVAFNRVDWVLSFPFSDMPGAPNPGDLRMLAPKWLEGVGKWLNNISFSINRVASGGVLFNKVDSISSGNYLINNFLPFVNIDDPHKVGDLMIQVNLPKNFNCFPSMRHNRICKIGVLNRQLITIGPAGFPTTVIDTVVRGEFDMSSALENTSAIPGELVHPMTKEMTNAFLIILTKGMIDD